MLLEPSAAFAVWGSSFTFTCTVFNARDLHDLICFWADSGDFWCVNQEVGRCSTMGRAGNYITHCGPHSQERHALAKVYSLKILHVSDVPGSNYNDAREWWCALHHDRETSNRINLIVHGKVCWLVCVRVACWLVCESGVLVSVREWCVG